MVPDLGQCPSCALALSGRALAGLHQIHVRDQFSGMDGFGPMPCWSCLVYLMSEGNLSNSARSQQETPFWPQQPEAAEKYNH